MLYQRIPHGKSNHKKIPEKKEDESIRMKDTNSPTVESLKRELRTLRESAEREIQNAWSEIEQLEADKSSIIQRNMLISEKLQKLMGNEQPAPTCNSEKGEIWEGWGETTPDNACWLGWNSSSNTAFSSPNGSANLPSKKSTRSHFLCNDGVKGEIEDHLSTQKQNETPSEYEIQIDNENIKYQKSVLIRPFSLFQRKKNKDDVRELTRRNNFSDEYVRELRHKLAMLEMDSTKSCEKIKQAITEREVNIATLKRLSEKQENTINEKKRELEMLQERLNTINGMKAIA